MKFLKSLLLLCLPVLAISQSKPFTSEKLLFGVTYYGEYMPYERLEKDVAMMKDAEINVVRIAEKCKAVEDRTKLCFSAYHQIRDQSVRQKTPLFFKLFSRKCQRYLSY